MKRACCIIIVGASALLITSALMTRAQDVQGLKSELANVQSEIKAAQTEEAKYSGGLVKTLIASRVAILRQTEAMLKQKDLSINIGRLVKYTIDGKPFMLPSSAGQMLVDVESDILENQTKIKRQELEAARFSGGLAQAVAISTLETMRQTLAMLEQKRSALKYGLPQYVGFAESNDRHKNSLEASPHPDQESANQLRKIITLAVTKKGFIPRNIDVHQFQDYITIECTYENVSERDLRAFTGKITFQDLFGKEIFAANVTISNPVKAGQRGIWKGTIDFNQFIDSHRHLRDTELQDVQVVWNPNSVIFSDGERVEAETAAR